VNILSADYADYADFIGLVGKALVQVQLELPVPLLH
jgi:hypothetical protein